MARFFTALVMFTLASAARADDADVAIPSAVPPHFSQLVGKYAISAAAAPTEVGVEQPITLKVQITGQGPKNQQPQRARLRIFPEDIADDFFVEDVPEQDRAQPEGVWEFVYRLRPKHETVIQIPGLRLLYFSPRIKRFQSSVTDEIPIKVTAQPHAQAVISPAPVRIPERFRHARPAEDVLRDDSPRRAPELWVLAALLALPPGACLLWAHTWRRYRSTAAASRHLHRCRAARVASAVLEKHIGDAPSIRAAAVAYLRQRFDLRTLEPTRNDVASHLMRLGIPKRLVTDWTEFLQSCDRFEFAPTFEEPQKSLNIEALRLVQALEAEPCAMP